MLPFSGPLASSSGSTLFAQEFKQILGDSSVPQNAPALPPTPTPTPTNEALTFSARDWTAEVEGSGEKQTDPIAPCGILKRSSSTGSTDHDWTSPVTPTSSSEMWTDRKQVRFSPEVTRRRAKLQSGKELGEHSVLDVDSIPPPLVDKNSDQENSTVTTHNPFLSERPLDAQVVDAITPSLVDLSSGLENCNVSTNPFLSLGPLDAHEVDLACENKAKLQEQETTPSQVIDGKTCEKLIFNINVSNSVEQLNEQLTTLLTHLSRKYCKFMLLQLA